MSRRCFFFPVLIVLAGLMAYANTFSAPFQFDDDAYIVNNTVIRTFRFFLSPGDVFDLTQRSPDAVPPAIRSAFMTRIVAHFSFAVNYHLHGLSVTGYHIVNTAIHIVNGLLVFLIVKSMMASRSFRRLNNILQPENMAGITALLFVVHPIQTQAVTYLSQRFASLAALFCLLALLFYIRSCSTPGIIGATNRAVALLSTVAAMLTKEFSIILPLLLAVYDGTFVKGSWSERIKRLAPFGLTLAIIPALIFIQQPHMVQLDGTMRSITAADTSGISRESYLLTQFPVMMLYLRLFFFPIGQNVDHDVLVHRSLFEPPVFFSFLALFGLLVAGTWMMAGTRKDHENRELTFAGFGILWFFLMLSIESSVIPLGELAAEYRLYLPSVGMIITVVSLVSYAARRVSSLAKLTPVFWRGLVVCTAVALLAGTVLRNTVWSSECALWEDAARKSPARARPHQNLAFYYGKNGRLEDAKRELTTALKLDPGSFELHNNLGVVYKQLGAYDEAVAEYKNVLAIEPGDVMARYNLGNVYLAQGRTVDAVREFEATVRLIPDYDEVHNNLGIAYYKSGRIDDAIIEFKRALELNPHNMHARKNLEESWKQVRLFGTKAGRSR